MANENLKLTDEQRVELRERLKEEIPGKCFIAADRLCQYASQTIVSRTEHEYTVAPRSLETEQDAYDKAKLRGEAAERLCPGVDLTGDRTHCRFGEGNVQPQFTPLGSVR